MSISTQSLCALGDQSTRELTQGAIPLKASFSPREQETQAAFAAFGFRLPSRPFAMYDGKMLSLDGKEHKLSDYRGKTILLNLWSPSCPACRDEMPSMDVFLKRVSSAQVALVALTVVNPPADSLEAVQKIASEHRFPVFVDPDGSLMSAYHVGLIPATYVIDKNGYLRALATGAFEWQRKDFLKCLELLRTE